jgi:hypothetical protein
MSQTLLEMAKDLVMAQIAAHRLSPEEMHPALQQTYASLKALQALEDAPGCPDIVSSLGCPKSGATQAVVDCAATRRLRLRRLLPAQPGTHISERTQRETKDSTPEIKVMPKARG